MFVSVWSNLVKYLLLVEDEMALDALQDGVTQRRLEIHTCGSQLGRHLLG